MSITVNLFPYFKPNDYYIMGNGIIARSFFFVPSIEYPVSLKSIQNAKSCNACPLPDNIK